MKNFLPVSGKMSGTLVFTFFLFLNAYFGIAQTVTTDKLDYAPGETAIITGTGWTEDQFVDVHLHEEPVYEHDHDYHGIAVDATGNWEIQYPIEERHLGVTFTVEVIGLQSGATATTVFTDGVVFPSGINTSSQDQELCPGGTSNPLVASITTCEAGGGATSYRDISYTWYYNTTDSNVISGSTQTVLHTNTTAATTSTSYTPPTNYSGTRYYFSRVTFNPRTGQGGQCGQENAPGYPFTTGTIAVTVEDNEAPVFANVPADQLNVTMDEGACGATITWTDPTANDNCDGSVSVVRTDVTGYNSGDLFAEGSYTISYSATDSEGNVQTASFAVNVNADAEKPVFANVPADQLNVTMDEGACGATITWTDPTANDNCDGSVNVVRTDATGYNSGDLFAEGSYTISYSATDSEGNVQTASFAVSVNADAEKPVFANVPADQLNVTMDEGACGATITWTDPTANDNCDGSVSVVRTDVTGYNSGDLFAEGSYTISYSATDSEGNVQTASFAVSVNADAEKPVFANVPADQLNVTMDEGACGATITWTDPTANDNCDGSVSVVRTDVTGYNSGDLFAAGSYTISYSATDSEGNVQTASFAVSVNADAEKPVFANVPADQLNVSMDEGACGATITWTHPTANDNCDGSVSVVRTDVTGYNSGDLFAEGSYTISYSATDSEGNVQTASFAVSVNADAEKPVFANVPADQLNVTMDEGACGATITWTDPTANDNCDGSVSVVRTDVTGYNSGDLFAEGSYTISYSATDSEGNVQTASFAVSVNADAEDPVFANVPADQLNVTMDEGACGATITWTDPTANDNCDGSVTVVRTDATGYNSGDLFAAGSYTISYSATDSEGNVQTASFAVNVNADAEKPVFANVPADQLNVTMDEGACGATITWTDPTANDNCDGSVTVVRTDATGYNSGDLFAAGSYTISYSATDSEGNVQTASFAVNVNADAEKPVFANVPADQLNVTMDEEACGATITWTDPTANDNCDGSVTVVRTDATGYNSGDLFAAGSYTISYSATDSEGNVQTASFAVSVNADAEKPVFANVPADQLNVTMDEGACGATITWTDPTANDNCDGSVTVVRTDATGYNSGDLFAAGSYTISYSATDSEGNVQTASFAVNVNADAEKPVFANVPADQLNVTMDEGACGATITWTDPTANDNCDGSVTVVRTDATGYNSGDLFAAGSYTISYSATDSEGNVQTASFAVSVNADAEKPVFANVPADQLNVAMDAGACGATITWTDPTANDNCDGSVTVVRTDATGYNSGDLFAAGSYTISYSATDSEGNVQTASFAVSVNADAEKPVFANVPADQLNVAMDAGACGATVSWTAPTSADNCSGSSIAQTAGPASGSVFSVGTTTITYKATDASGNTHSESFTVTVTNNAPGNIVITGPIEPQPLGTSIKMEATFVDENIKWATWQAFNGSVIVQSEKKSASGNYTTHTFLNLPAGVYTIILKLEDHCGETGEEKFQYVTIYDPDGGFVTGGGWINSPVGAMPAKPATIGKANFGFVSKYKKGSNQVDGNTEFQFNAGDVNFKSTMHESGSLVISGKKATYRGTGTINGGSGYKFVVVAIDGNMNGASDPDRFRIKISTTTGTVIYDNQIGKDENTEDATILGNNGQGGGSIVIHEVKKKQAETTEKIGATTNLVEPEIQILNSLEIAPNPMVYSTEIRFSLLKDSSAEIKIFDMNGRLVKNLYSGNVRANELVSLEFNRENLMSGIYICKLLTGDGRSYEKQIVIN